MAGLTLHLAEHMDTLIAQGIRDLLKCICSVLWTFIKITNLQMMMSSQKQTIWYFTNALTFLHGVDLMSFKSQAFSLTKYQRERKAIPTQLNFTTPITHSVNQTYTHLHIHQTIRGIKQNCEVKIPQFKKRNNTVGTFKKCIKTSSVNMLLCRSEKKLKEATKELSASGIQQHESPGIHNRKIERQKEENRTCMTPLDTTCGRYLGDFYNNFVLFLFLKLK